MDIVAYRLPRKDKAKDTENEDCCVYIIFDVTFFNLINSYSIYVTVYLRQLCYIRVKCGSFRKKNIHLRVLENDVANIMTQVYVLI